MNNLCAITSDFGTIGTAIAMIVIAALQYYHLHRSKKRDGTVQAIKATVEEVHKLTNGSMSEQLQIGMISAETLANLTKLPEHRRLADTAAAKYSKHMDTERHIRQKSEGEKALVNSLDATTKNQPS